MNRLLLASLIAAIGTSAWAQNPSSTQRSDATGTRSATAASAEPRMNAILSLVEQANEAIANDELQRALSLLDQADRQLEQTMQQVPAQQRASLQKTQERIRSASTSLRGDDVARARESMEIAATESRRFDADILANLQVSVPRPEVNVQQADPQVQVEQRAPRVDVDPGRPQVTVRQAAPQVTVAMAQPTITIEMPRPEIIVEMPDPSVSVDAQPPRVTVNQARPTVSVEQGRPQVRVGEVESSVDRPAQPRADGQGDEGRASLAQSTEGQPPAKVAVEKGQPQVSMAGRSQPQVTIAEVEPQVRYQAAEPKVKVESAGDPVVRFNQTGEPNVQIRQLDADETRAMAASDAREGRAPGARGDERGAGASASSDASSTRGGDRQPSASAAADASAGAGARAGASAGREMTAGRLVDADIVGENGNKLGDIEKLVDIDGRLYAVIASGGFLGLGEKETAIPLSALVLRDDKVMAPQVSSGRIDRLRDFDSARHDAVPSDRVVMLGHN
ncbi:MAG: PRC-barrel domain-containing protein [Lautropia sp.]